MSTKQPKQITSDELERLTGLTDRRHRQIAKEGFFPPPANGVYQFQPTIAGMFRYYQESVTARSSLTDERQRLVREQADAAALANASTRGELVEVEAVSRHMENVFVGLRAGVLSSNLSPEEKSDCLLTLKRITNDVARIRTKPNGVARSDDKGESDTESATEADGQ